MNTTSQDKAILTDLKAGQKVTQMDALLRHGCFRLASRICDLRKAGHKIATTTIDVGKKRVAEYTLIQ